MKENEKDFPIEKMASVLGVSARGYYASKNRIPSLRRQANAKLVEAIKQIYQEGRMVVCSNCFRSFF